MLKLSEHELDRILHEFFIMEYIHFDFIEEQDRLRPEQDILVQTLGHT